MAANRPVALVTGASSGVGKETARALVDAGFDVVGTSRKAAGDTTGGVTFLPLDVTSDDSVSSLVQQVIERFGRIDVLVNNAGVGANGAAEEISVAQAQYLFDVNVFGLMRMTNAVLPHMRGQGRGRIINVSSVGGFVPNPFMAIYVATKHAVEGYSESLDHEVREQGIRVLRVQPGPINTPFDQNTEGADPSGAAASDASGSVPTPKVMASPGKSSTQGTATSATPSDKLPAHGEAPPAGSPTSGGPGGSTTTRHAGTRGPGER
ncbi:SDR family NAD(P)-dependent oxidoreductase [Streptomyces sp. NPDC005486]|uniref:SDR family NAD(P)-dependent oxidoreductase n=1 Tax=Streptomyces sp. NPDC005486 TaxID=3155345 RepID=UPI0033A39707